VIWMARFFTLVFGVLTIVVAIWIPSAGGIVEVVLSTASIAGGALFAPIIWTLFSKRQTGFSVVTATVTSLLINLFFKVITPGIWDLKFDRTMETCMGMGIPIAVLLFFEIYYTAKGRISIKVEEMEQEKRVTAVRVVDPALHIEAAKQNKFGIGVIALSMGIVGIGIGILGYIAKDFSITVMVVGGLILISAGLIWRVDSKKLVV